MVEGVADNLLQNALSKLAADPSVRVRAELACADAIEIRVVADDERVLAAQFERAVLEALGRGCADDFAHSGGSGQRNGTHGWVLGERRPDFRPEAGNDVDDRTWSDIENEARIRPATSTCTTRHRLA